MPARPALPEIPISATIDAVVSFAAEACPPFLMGHNYRAFRFGRMLITDDLDDEIAFVASMLHDIALVDPHIGTTSFELVGAEVAARFLEARGWPSERIRIVEQAIVRHVELAPADLPEMRVVQAGAALDVAGFPPEAIDQLGTQAILAAHPRGGMAKDLPVLIRHEIARQPDGVFARLEAQINLTDLVARNPLDHGRTP
jgi:hypothetical protein